MTGGQPRPLPKRFWAKVNKIGPDDCWEWTGCKRQHGYGAIYVDGHMRPAHRVAWELHNGRPFPEGKFACHACDTPHCVNPAHIWPGTQTDNMRDAVRKGRASPPPLRKPQNKTHCPSGHALTGDNLFMSQGRRCCRTCKRECGARHMRKKRAEAKL